jgi:UDP-N-acetylmuramate dehydrogenase
MADLMSRLPTPRGELTPKAEMAKHTWFGVGGPAEVMFSPADQDDLISFITNTPKDIPVYPFGAGSNLLVRDGGMDGVAINTTKFMNTLACHGDVLTVGAGIYDADVARKAARLGMGGLEFLIGIPGTIGGGLRMNAGAYGREFKDVIICATAIDRDGNIHTATPDEMGMSYRHSDAPQDWIFTEARLKAAADDTDSIKARMKEIVASRGDAQPKGARTGGSTFTNPIPHKAWQLIDAAGCRGMSNGAAMVSEKHCNFLINTGGATATEIETLGETVRKRVHDTSGVEMRWEIRRIGKAVGEDHG